MSDRLQRFKILYEIWHFARATGKWWIAPLMVIALLVGFLLSFAEGSMLAPFIYSIF